MDQRVFSGDNREVRFLQLNERVYAVGGGLNSSTMQHGVGLQQCSAISDQQKIDELHHQHHHHHHQQQQQQHQQQQVDELTEADRQVTTSSHNLTSFTTSAAATADGTFIHQSTQKPHNTIRTKRNDKVRATAHKGLLTRASLHVQYIALFT